MAHAIALPRESPKPDPPPHEDLILNLLRCAVIFLNLFGYGDPYVFYMVAAAITVRLLWVALHCVGSEGNHPVLPKVALVLDVYLLASCVVGIVRAVVA